MPFPLVGAPGNLFNALGKMGLIVANVNSFQTTLKPNLIDPTNGLLAQLTGEPDIAATIGSNWISMLSSLENPASYMPSLAQSVMNRLVYNYNPQLFQTLTSSNLNASISYIYEQMISQGATILQMTVGATTTAFAGTGTGAVTCSLKRPFDGKALENAYAETLTFTCTADSYTGGQTAYNEQFAVTGEGQEPDVFAFSWPLGSNGNITINAIDGDTSNGSGNLLINSGFTTWTNGVPNNWTVGAGGSTITQNQSIIYSAGSSLQITGDGATLTSISQALNSTTGTTSTLSVQTAYSVNFFLRAGGTAPAQGVLQVDLVDGSGAIINDQAGNPNSFTVNLAGLGVSWVAYNGFFRIPTTLSSTYSIRVHLTTALTNGAVVYLDKLSLGVAQQVYVQGPFVAVHSGNIPFVASPTSDTATAVVTNSRGAGGTLSTFQTMLFRLLSNAISYELIWPSSLTPTISDSLIS